MSGDGGSLDETMAAVAMSLHREAEVEDMLRLIVFSARDTVPGAEYAGISVARSGQPLETIAGTDAIVYQVDQLQSEFNEGPCVDAVREKWQALTGDLRTELRWPRYAPQAARLGVISQLGLRLFSEPGVAGALTLYSRTPGAFSQETAHVAALFALHAAEALGKRMAKTPLTESLNTRKVIAQATGIVMERYQLSEQRAFAFLARASRASTVRMYDLAAKIVHDTDKLGRPAARVDQP